MKSRYCNEVKNPTRVGKSDIEKYLKNEIEFLLAPSAEQLLEVSWEDIYINIPELENDLRSYLEYSRSDRTLFLTGVTGSGKSMVLKNVFNIKNMTPRIENKCLIIPFAFDNLQNEVKDFFANMILCACDLIEEKRNVKLAAEYEKEFYESIKKTRGDNSQRGKKWPRDKEMSTISERIRAYSEETPISFSSSLLKFYLNQPESDINNVLFIVDDIEGIGEEKELLPVKTIYEVLTCMENSSKSRRWSSKVIISCRNYVYRIVSTRKMNDYAEFAKMSNQTLESYEPTNHISLKTDIKLLDIIQKRYEAIIKESSNEKWKLAMQVVNILLTEIDNSIGDLILNLNIGNFRKSLNTLKKIVFNKTWIQRDYKSTAMGAFCIDDIEKFDVKSVNLIRALTMENNIVYNSANSIIPNLLFNYEGGIRDLYVLMTAKYFWDKRGKGDWESTIDIDLFYKNIQELFGANSEQFENFKWAVEYLVTNRMLLRSIDQIQKDSSSISSKNVDKIKKVYVSPALDEIYQRLNQNSVLFEIYIDDLWMDNSARDYPPKMVRSFISDKFLACLRYMNVVIDCEKNISCQIIGQDKIKLYDSLFPRGYISEYLLLGLEKSYNAFYRGDEPNKREEKERLRMLLQNCRNRIDKELCKKGNYMYSEERTLIKR